MTTTQSEYQDALGRTQIAVSGPGGHYLVTRGNTYEPYEVWRSDSLRTNYTDKDLGRALNMAHKLADRTAH